MIKHLISYLNVNNFLFDICKRMQMLNDVKVQVQDGGTRDGKLVIVDWVKYKICLCAAISPPTKIFQIDLKLHQLSLIVQREALRDEKS